MQQAAFGYLLCLHPASTSTCAPKSLLFKWCKVLGAFHFLNPENGFMLHTIFSYHHLWLSVRTTTGVYRIVTKDYFNFLF